MLKAKLSNAEDNNDIAQPFEVGMVGNVPVVTYKTSEETRVIYLDVRDMPYTGTGCGHDWVETAVAKYGPYRRLRPGETIEITCAED